jgi:hypothetical protein
MIEDGRQLRLESGATAPHDAHLLGRHSLLIRKPVSCSSSNRYNLLQVPRYSSVS